MSQEGQILMANFFFHISMLQNDKFYYSESITMLNKYICAILAKSVHLKIDKVIF